MSPSQRGKREALAVRKHADLVSAPLRGSGWTMQDHSQESIYKAPPRLRSNASSSSGQLNKTFTQLLSFLHYHNARIRWSHADMKAPTMISLLALSFLAAAVPAKGIASTAEVEGLAQRDTAAASVIYSGVSI